MPHKRTIMIVVFILLLPLLAVNAIGGDVPYFTDQDLLKYSKGNPSGASRQSDSSFQSVNPPSGKAQRVYRVKYTPFEGLTRRIIVKATFNDTVQSLAAIDTGADSVVISRRLAERMGIMENNEGKFLWQASGIGGTTLAFITILDSVSIGGARVEFLPVLITNNLSDQFDGLIGMDFLSNFSFYIDSRSHYLVLEEKGENKGLPAGRDRNWWLSNFKRFKHYREFWLRLVKEYSSRKQLSPRDREILQKLRNQYREAERLFYRLNNYAIENNVPLSWRVY